MPRSEASLAKRREYYKKWREANPDYHKKWREKNAPKEKERIKAWKKSNPDKVREQKLRYYAKNPRPSKAQPDIPIPKLHLGHELFDQARKVVNRIFKIDNRAAVYNPAYEDAISEVVLAYLENKNPIQAAHQFKQYEGDWARNAITGTRYEGIFEVSETGFAHKKSDMSVW